MCVYVYALTAQTPLIDIGFEAIVAGTQAAPFWEAWALRSPPGDTAFALPTSNVPLDPSPPPTELAARGLGLLSRHAPAAALQRWAQELELRQSGERRGEAHLLIYGSRRFHLSLETDADVKVGLRIRL